MTAKTQFRTCFSRKAARRKERLADMDENQISKIVVDCYYRIHTKLGPGLLESVYLEIKKSGLKVRKGNRGSGVL